MKPGRVPKPSVVRSIERGEPDAPDDEPLPLGTLPEPPADSSEEVRRVWTETLQAAPAGLLRRLDIGLFAVYCRAVVQYDKAMRHVEANGAVVVTKAGTVVENPWHKTAIKQALLMIRTVDQLGFSPAARTRIRVTPSSAPVAETTQATNGPNRFARNGVRRAA